jgi:hypothetical protein
MLLLERAEPQHSSIDADKIAGAGVGTADFGLETDAFDDLPTPFPAHGSENSP